MIDMGEEGEMVSDVMGAGWAKMICVGVIVAVDGNNRSVSMISTNHQIQGKGQVCAM